VVRAGTGALGDGRDRGGAEVVGSSRRLLDEADKFKSRYATLGFEEAANLDDGPMWPTSFALKELTAACETKIRALVKQAVS
jgi:uncharacterized protein YdhG (YjbR/CyaY superfamily)